MTRKHSLLALALPPLAWLFWPLAESVEPCSEAHRAAATYPDYAGVVIPPNVAPLNLRVLEAGRKYCLRIAAGASKRVEVFSADGVLRIPRGAWRELLAANRGGDLLMDIYAKGDGGWLHFDTVRDRIAAEPVDPYVVYRYIPPVYDRWDRISIRQRNLATFDERILFDNYRDTGRAGEGVCVNCHTFLNHDGDRMLLHMRPSQHGQIPAMIVAKQGRAERVDARGGSNPPAAYISWHPNGKLLAFSRNRLVQVFHTAGVEVRDVVDRDSDLALYDVDTRQVYTVPQISRPDRLETFPAWSPDGRYLYFSSAPMLWPDKKSVPNEYDKVQYDLVRVPYDAASNKWGEAETVVSATQLQRSISLPQISPDGHFLMFCGHDYGSFPIFQPSSDLYLLDLTKPAAARRLDEINSPRADSYHTWSSNSRWVIFASKREDGVFARLYLTHLEPDGRFSKPLLMPQEDPTFYGRTLMTYNRPELIASPVTVTGAELWRAMGAPLGAAPSAGSAPADSPWRPMK